MDLHPHMQQAIRLAQLATGRTRPNPMVGCVIVRDGAVLATGYHHRAGEPHGEIDALRKLQPGEARGADLYVNLEPCCTHGRTPPCTDAIIEAGIARVFIGTVDTNPRVQGAGINALRQAGIEVVTGVLENESRRLNAAYFSTMERRRPFVAAKWAMSLDGKIATHAGDSAWITSDAARHRVHELRNVYDAILVGTRTLLQDDPRLTCRLDGEDARDPVRVVLDTELRAAHTSRVFDTSGTIVAHARGADFSPFAARGAVSLPLDLTDGRLPVATLLERLLAHDIMSVFVEGGGAVLGSMFDAGLVDRVYAFVAPRILGGADATPAVAGRGVDVVNDSIQLHDVRLEQAGDDFLIIGDIWSCLPDS